MFKYLLALCLTGSAQAEVIRQSGGGTSTGLSGTVSCANGSSVNIDGGTLYVDCTNNRVGVVNSAPGYPLDVVGAVHATGQAIIGGTGTVKGNAFSVGGSTLVVSQGQVGVGQASPGYPLDVTGDSHATGQLIVGGTATVKGAAFSVGGSTLTVMGGKIGVGGTNTDSEAIFFSSGMVVAQSSSASTGAEVFEARNNDGSVILSVHQGGGVGINSDAQEGYDLRVQDSTFTIKSGNVGIGTASPVKDFHIQRSADAAMRLQRTGVNPSYWDFNAGYYTANGDFWISNASQRFIINASGNVGIGGIASPGAMLDVSGTTNLSGAVTVAGSSLTVQGNAFSVGGSSLVVNQGLVGIGTAQPSVKLHLSSGTLLVDGSGADVQFPAGVVGTAEIANAAIDTDKLATDAVTSAKVLNAAVTTAKIADLAVDTAKLAADAVTAAKIINSAVETAKIAADAVTAAKIINGAIETDKLATDAVTTAKILNANVTAAKLVNSGVFTGDATTTFPAITIGAGAIDTAKLATDSVTSSKLLNDADSLAKVSNQVVVNSGGNIGIGVANPGTRLDVSGAGSFTSGVTLSSLTVTNGSIQIPDNLAVKWGTGAAAIEGHSVNGTLRFFTTNAEKMRLNASGNLGLGVTAPGSRLDVNGTSNLNGAFTVTGGTVTFTENAFSVGVATLAVTNGNVGIGVASPGSKLEVNGPTALIGSLTTSSITATGIITSGNEHQIQSGFGFFVGVAANQYTAWRSYIGPDNSPQMNVGPAGGYSRSLVLSDRYYEEWDHGSPANMTFFLQDATDPDVTNNKWLSFNHDGTGGVIRTGDKTGAGTSPATVENYLLISPAGTEQARFSPAGVTLSSHVVVVDTLTVRGNAFSVGVATLAIVEGNVGIGVTAPTAKLHMSSGTLLVDGAGAAINTTGQYKVKDMVAFSSVPIMHAGGFNSTLGSGTTFFAFVPDSAVTLRRITATIVVAGIGGTGDTWFCSDGTNSISVTTGAGAAAGTVSTATGSAGVAAGVQVNGRLEATGGTSPTANVLCEYSMQ